MDKIDVILWVLSGGFSLMLIMWYSINQRIDRLESRIDGVDTSLSARIDKLDEKITDIDRRLCRMEGAFTTKECCMLKEDRHYRKSEGA